MKNLQYIIFPILIILLAVTNVHASDSISPKVVISSVPKFSSIVEGSDFTLSGTVSDESAVTVYVNYGIGPNWKSWDSWDPISSAGGLFSTDLNGIDLPDDGT